MTSRQRFHETMKLGNPDRVPLLDEGIRKEVLVEWHKQGLQKNGELSQLFTIDPSSEIDLDLDIHSEYKKPIRTIEDITLLRKRYSHKKLRDHSKNLLKKLEYEGKRDHIILLKVHPGFFLSMGVNDWSRFTEVGLLLIQKPEFVDELLLFQAELISDILDFVLPKSEVDAVIFAEPIGGNEGPLISPAMYEKFVLNSYKPILDVIMRHGVDTAIMRSYANIRILIPSIVKCGFNCLWACETNSEQMNYKDIRKEFGRDLRLIGGIDLDTLRSNKIELRSEIEKNVPQLLSDGGYIPLADGRIRPDIPYQNYVYYRMILEKMV